MNQIQFWILNGLAGLLAILLIAHIFLTRAANYDQNFFYAEQQEVNVDQAYLRNAQVLAQAIAAELKKNDDAALKTLAIKYDLATPAPSNSSSSSSSSSSSTGGTPTGGTSTPH